jgi:hypothetical protein
MGYFYEKIVTGTFYLGVLQQFLVQGVDIYETDLVFPQDGVPPQRFDPLGKSSSMPLSVTTRLLLWGYM